MVLNLVTADQNQGDFEGSHIQLFIIRDYKSNNEKLVWNSTRQKLTDNNNKKQSKIIKEDFEVNVTIKNNDSIVLVVEELKPVMNLILILQTLKLIYVII